MRKMLTDARVALMMLFTLLPLALAEAQAIVNLPDFTELVEKYSPAVVNISTTQKMKHPPVRRMPKQQEGAPDAPPGQEAPFNDLFKHFFGEQGEDMEPFDTQSLGSGFVISSDGYLMTNYHVIKDADEVVVRLSDRRELVAKVVGSDERSDLALLKVEAKDLPVIKVGRSDKLKVGEWVLAIGSPFGFDHTVTAGIVSAMGRNLPRENYVPFIQTDVAINPGNSGGPLFNLRGEVVGINSQIYSPSGGYVGLSFAIPVNVAMEVAEQLKTSGQVSRGYLGVVTQDITRDLADAYNLPRPAGALVSKVLPGTPAEKAGLRDGDVITQFNGRDIVRHTDLPFMIGRAKVGSSYPLTVYRDGKGMNLTFQVAALPEDQTAGGNPRSKKPAKPDLSRLGIGAIRDLSPEEKQTLKIDGGAIILQLLEGAADDAGLRVGDVIVSVLGKPVRDAQQFVDRVKDLPAGKAIPVGINRRGQPMILALRLAPAEADKKK